MSGLYRYRVYATTAEGTWDQGGRSVSRGDLIRFATAAVARGLNSRRSIIDATVEITSPRGSGAAVPCVAPSELGSVGALLARCLVTLDQEGARARARSAVSRALRLELAAKQDPSRAVQAAQAQATAREAAAHAWDLDEAEGAATRAAECRATAARWQAQAETIREARWLWKFLDT